MINDFYKKILTKIRSFLKKQYWNKFTNYDIFHFMIDNKRYVASFISNFYGDSFGIQIYNTADGMNYLSDIFTEEDEEINLVKEFECDALCIILSEENSLSADDKVYLKERGVRVKEDNNLLLYRFESGYGRRYANFNEEVDILRFLDVLSDILNDNLADLEENFAKELSALAFVNEEERSYYLTFGDLPYLETPITNHKVYPYALKSLQEIKKEKDSCFINILYSPIVCKEDNVRPVMVYFYYPEKNYHKMAYMICNKKKYKEEFWNVVLNVFDEYHIPKEIYINNRRFYSYIAKTFKEMKIKVELNLDGDLDKQIIDSISHVFNVDIEIKEEKEKIVELLDAISHFISTINQLVPEDEEEIDEESENEDSYVS
ncbi:MAG: hypothetical protein IJU60_06780 [Acholeplasmatales bacterium]|nr:hypothetical protein [Acholeplasmatales bacterium]